MDGRLAFDAIERELKLIASIEDTTAPEMTVLSAFPTSEVAPQPGGPIEGFLLVSATGERDGEALYYAAGLGAAYL